MPLQGGDKGRGNGYGRLKNGFILYREVCIYDKGLPDKKFIFKLFDNQLTGFGKAFPVNVFQRISRPVGTKRDEFSGIADGRGLADTAGLILP